MCGFVGFCNSGIEDMTLRAHVLEEMTAKIKHRGPDDVGYFSDETISLGFNRLKILDLVGGEQPMLSADGRYVLCFNGEIYNYIELREELKRDFGDVFSETGDTEVLLHTLVHYGERALERLRGMFCFAFYDRLDGTLLLARDPLGIKPLYYGIFDGCFMFASEIKAFLSHPQFVKQFNADMLAYYLQFQYVPCEETAFVGVKRLMPGHILVYKESQAKVSRYFDLPRFTKADYTGYSFFAESDGQKRIPLPYKKSIGKVSRRLMAVLDEAVQRHMRSDVSVGGFLSGGVDSGLVCALARPSKLYTVGFKNADFDERARAVKNAERMGIPITSVEVDADDFFRSVEAVQYYSDEPYANLSAIPLYLLAKRASQDVGVILSGEGADELFGGYEWYEDSYIGKLYRKLPEKARRVAAKRALEGRVGEFLKRNAFDAEREFIGQAKIMTAPQAYSILNEPYKRIKNPESITSPIYDDVKNASLLRKKMYLDMQLWLPFDILNKADKMTMASSIELRVPYLDLSVLSIAEGCGERLLMSGKTGKYVLRKASEEALDGETAYRAKKGFPVPFRAWIREKRYAQILRQAFTGEIGRHFFDTDALCKMLDEHVRGEKNNARILYTVYAFIVWYKVFFEETEQKTMAFEVNLRENLEGKAVDERISADNTRL